MSKTILLTLLLLVSPVASTRALDADHPGVRKAFYDYFKRDASMQGTALEIVEIIDLRPRYAIDLLQVNYDVMSSGFRMPAALYMTRDGRFVLAGKLQDARTMLNITRELAHTERFRFDISLIPEDGSPGYPWDTDSSSTSVKITFIADFACGQCLSKLMALKSLAKDYQGAVQLRYLNHPASQKSMKMGLLLQAARGDPETYWTLIDRLYRDYPSIPEASLEPELVSGLLPEDSDGVAEPYKRLLESGEDLSLVSRFPVRIVPMILVNDIVLTDEMSPDEIRLIIDEAMP